LLTEIHTYGNAGEVEGQEAALELLSLIGRALGATQKESQRPGRSVGAIRQQEEIDTMSKKLFISFASLLALAAFAVMPVASQAATGSPHYYSGLGAATIMGEGERVADVGFGTLSLTNTAGGSGGKVTCHNVVGGWVENPEGSGTETGHKGPGGIGETQAFDPYECESAACTAAATGGGPATYISVLAEPTPFVSVASPGGNATNLGWKSILIDDTTGTGTPKHEIRSETIEAKVNVHCHVQTGATGTGEPIFGVVTAEISEGNNFPWTGPARSAVTPSYNFTEFDNKSAANGKGSGELHGPPPSETGRLGKTEGALEVVQYGAPIPVNTKNG
jgi:hypothetical protein